jgi:hypothetical protein
MDRVGVAFQSALTADEVRTRYIAPLHQALEEARSNYLRQLDDNDGPPEHLLVFQIHNFEAGLRLLRTTMEKLGPPPGTTLHNLNASDPMY